MSLGGSGDVEAIFRGDYCLLYQGAQRAVCGNADIVVGLYLLLESPYVLVVACQECYLARVGNHAYGVGCELHEARWSAGELGGYVGNLRERVHAQRVGIGGRSAYLAVDDCCVTVGVRDDIEHRLSPGS